jgi:hypothetical protein
MLRRNVKRVRLNKHQLTNVELDKKLTHKETASGVMTISPRVQMVCHALSQTAPTEKSSFSMVLALPAQCTMFLMKKRRSVNFQNAQMAGRLPRKESALSANSTPEV